MEEQNNLEKLFNDAKEYLNTRLELTKLELVQKVSQIVSSLITSFLLLVIFVLVLLFGSVSLALFLSEKTGSTTTGFLYVAGIYLALGLLIYLLKGSFIKKPVTDMFIRKMLNKDEED